VIALLLAACTSGELPPPPDDAAADSAGTGGAADSADAGDSASADDSASPGDSSPGDTDPGDPDAFSLGEVQGCAAPRDAVTYTEVGEAWGLQPGPDPEADHLDGGGLVVHDLDGDGDLDLVVSFWQSDLDVYTRVGDGYERATVESDGSQLSLADVDGDGQQDVVVGGHKPRAFLNEGGSLVRQKGIFSLDGGTIRQLAPGDFDGDGDMDLYAPATGPDSEEARQDLLLWNDGSGEFTVDRETLGTDLVSGQTFMAVVMDYEVDGDPDVYIDNDMGAQFGANVLIRNDGGALVDGTEGCACGLAHSGMGGDAADYNGDGLPDLYLAATGQNVLLASQAGGDFVDVTLSVGADPLGGAPYMAWGAIWLDYDNDGLLDLAVAQGDLWASDHEGEVFDAPVNLLRQSEGGQFEEVGPAAGIELLGSYRGVSAADHNGDGVLDLLVNEVVDRPLLYLSDGCTAAGWLAVEAPMNSRVEIEVGGVTRTAWIHPSSGFGAAGPLEAWFGLGEAQSVDRLRVILPWGRGEYTLQGPIEGRRRIRLVAP
jgi:hypothetical protein